jgi:c-di-GMP-binding flagellar brake protein YcgR
MNKIEQRKHARLLFSAADQARALIEVPEQEIVTATVLDISESGIGLSLAQNEIFIDQGERCIMIELRGLVGIHFDFGIEIEVRWLLNYEALGLLALGCRFINIPPPIRAALRNFVARNLKA